MEPVLYQYTILFKFWGAFVHKNKAVAQDPMQQPYTPLFFAVFPDEDVLGLPAHGLSGQVCRAVFGVALRPAGYITFFIIKGSLKAIRSLCHTLQQIARICFKFLRQYVFIQKQCFFAFVEEFVCEPLPYWQFAAG